MYKLGKRLIAYLIDMLIIIGLVSLLSNTTILNKNLNKYQKYSKQYSELTTEVTNFVVQLQKYYQDEKITEKEYNKLIKKYPTYEEKLNKYYIDKQLTNKNYKKLVKEVSKDYEEKANILSYKIEKNSISQMIIYLVLTIAYFVGFNYFTEGQTLGKKLFNLKIVNIEEDKKVSIISYIVRAILMYEIIYYAIRLSTIFFLKQPEYISLSQTIYSLQNALDFIIIACAIVRKDGRGLHDIIAKTKVMTYNKNKKEV